MARTSSTVLLTRDTWIVDCWLHLRSANRSTLHTWADKVVQWNPVKGNPDGEWEKVACSNLFKERWKCFGDVLEIFCCCGSETSRWSQLAYWKTHFQLPNFIRAQTLSVLESPMSLLVRSPLKLGSVVDTRQKVAFHRYYLTVKGVCLGLPLTIK